MGGKVRFVSSRQPRRWRADGGWRRVALNTWEVMLAVGAILSFAVMALLLLRTETDGRLPWVLWGIGFGAALFWVGKTMNDMMVRESSVRRIANVGRESTEEIWTREDAAS